VRQQLDMAVKTVERLNASGADVAIIGRIGQDLSKYHQRYSHIAIAYRDGQDWYVVHKLNECGTAVSNVYEQGMGQFFMDTPFLLEAYVTVPQPEVQQKLRAAIVRPQVTRMHEPQYSMLPIPGPRVTSSPTSGSPKRWRRRWSRRSAPASRPRPG
jgi:hypothetical protein